MPRQAVPVPLRSDGTPLAGVPERRGDSEAASEAPAPYRPPRMPAIPRVPCDCHPVELRDWNGGHGRTEHQQGCGEP